MNSTSENNLYNFLLNDDFIHYVVNPSLVLNEMWDEFFEEHPEMIPVANNAKDILLGRTITHPISAADSESILGNILKSVYM